MAAAFGIDLALVFAIMLGGFMLGLILLPREDLVRCLSLAFPLGAGILTMAAFLLSWAGLPVARWSVVTLIVTFAVVSTAIALRSTEKVRFHEARRLLPPRRGWLRWAASRTGLAVFLGFVAVALFLAVGISYSTWDAIAIWSVKGYGIAFEGSVVAGDVWGAHRLYYPLNVPLLIAFFRLLSGDVLPGSKAIFPLFYASTLLGAYCFWRRKHLSAIHAGIGVVLLATIPDYFLHATIGYANLPQTSYLVLGTLLAVEGVFDEDRRKQGVGSLMLGLGAWTRVEGVLYCLAILIGIVLGSWLSRRGRLHLLHLTLPMLAVVLPWFAFSQTHGGGSSPASGAMSKAIQEFLALQFHPGALRTAAAYLEGLPVEWTRWGLFFPVCAVLLVWGWKSLRPKTEPTSLALLLAFLGTFAGTVLIFYIGSFGSGTEGLGAWMGRGFPREFFTSVLLLGILSFMAAGRGDGAPVEVYAPASEGEKAIAVAS